MKSFAVIFSSSWAMCGAFDRAEARTCDFYTPGKDGFCKHTTITYQHQVEAVDKWNQKVTRIIPVPDFVDGGCYCDPAIAAGGKEL